MWFCDFCWNVGHGSLEGFYKHESSHVSLTLMNCEITTEELGNGNGAGSTGANLSSWEGPEGFFDSFYYMISIKHLASYNKKQLSNGIFNTMETSYLWDSYHSECWVEWKSGKRQHSLPITTCQASLFQIKSISAASLWQQHRIPCETRWMAQMMQKASSRSCTKPLLLWSGYLHYAILLESASFKEWKK